MGGNSRPHPAAAAADNQHIGVDCPVDHGKVPDKNFGRTVRLSNKSIPL
jgi:hypothetical protein